MHFHRFFTMNPTLLTESSIHRVSKLFLHENVEKRHFLHFWVRISQNPDAVDKFFDQIRIQRKKLRQRTSSNSISMKNDIFMNFHLFFESRRKTSS